MSDSSGQPDSGWPDFSKHPPSGQPPYGPPASGQPPYGPPASGQPPYGPPASGQPPYGQPGYPAPPPGDAGYGAASSPGLSPYVGPSEERSWSMGAHLAAPVGILLSAGLLSFLGPLVVLLVQGGKSAFVRRHAVEALNFQITTFIASIVIAIVGLVTCGLGFLLYIPLIVLEFLFGIQGTIRASNGQPYTYPFNIRLVS